MIRNHARIETENLLLKEIQQDVQDLIKLLSACIDAAPEEIRALLERFQSASTALREASGLYAEIALVDELYAATRELSGLNLEMKWKQNNQIH